MPLRTSPFDYDLVLARAGLTRVVGVDEAGRGPVAGPVVAAAVLLDPDTPLPGLDDSKVLTPAARATLLPLVRRAALSLGVGIVDAPTIDARNIREATRLAMRIAIENCLRGQRPRPQLVLIDGDFVANAMSGVPEQSLVKGDARARPIAAASIVAKETRDRLMERLATRYPGYGFEIHKGYLTALHRDALARLGPSPVHRRTFRGAR